MGRNGDLTLVGTTDVDHEGSPDDVHISDEETRYLTAIVRRLFPSYRGEPVSSYSALRPLIAEKGHSATSTSREHSIWETSDGVLHIAGGKYTTYRAMSEELVDMLSPLPCLTASMPLKPGAAAETCAQAVEREYARRLSDLLYVSTYWGYERAAFARMDRSRLPREWARCWVGMKPLSAAEIARIPIPLRTRFQNPT